MERGGVVYRMGGQGEWYREEGRRFREYRRWLKRGAENKGKGREDERGEVRKGQLREGSR